MLVSFSRSTRELESLEISRAILKTHFWLTKAIYEKE